MKIIRKAKTYHWAIGKQAECKRCETIVEFEDDLDFRLVPYDEGKVNFECPHCKHRQDFYKPKAIPTITWEPGTKSTPWYDSAPPGKVTMEKLAERYNVNEEDWMGNIESQQEYLGK